MNETLQILERVNAFYTASFTQLVTFTGAVLALVGVILPITIALQQSRTLKRDQASLERTIQTELKRAEDHLLAKINAAIEESHKTNQEVVASVREDMKKEISKLRQLAYGTAQHVQAETAALNRDFRRCFKEAVEAGYHYAKSGDENNISAIFSLTDSSLPFLDKEYFEEDPEINRFVERFTKSIRDAFDGARWHRELFFFDSGVTAAKRRQRPRPPSRAIPPVAISTRPSAPTETGNAEETE
jgi:hypothetical protein